MNYKDQREFVSFFLAKIPKREDNPKLPIAKFPVTISLLCEDGGRYSDQWISEEIITHKDKVAT